MEASATLFKTVYVDNQDVEICIAELKRKGFTQNDTIRAMMEVLGVDATIADQQVRDSLAWQD